MRFMRVRDLPGILFAAVLFAIPLSSVSAQEGEYFQVLDDIKLLAQKTALPELSGEDPIILREAWWSGSIEPGDAMLVQVQLFRRNVYRFWLAVPNETAGLTMNLYDGDGEIVKAETISYDTPNLVSTVVEADSTGIFYLRISLKETVDQPQDWALIYGYR